MSSFGVSRVQLRKELRWQVYEDEVTIAILANELADRRNRKDTMYAPPPIVPKLRPKEWTIGIDYAIEDYPVRRVPFDKNLSGVDKHDKTS